MLSQFKYKIANATGIPQLVNWFNRRKLLVLTYHGIYDGSQKKQMPSTFVHINDMVAQLKEIKKKYCITTPNELLKHLENGTPLPYHSAVITFDDGYESFARLAEPALNSLGIKAIVFIPTKYVEEQRPFWFDLFWLFAKQFTADNIDDFLKVFNEVGQQNQSVRQTLAKFMNKMKRMQPNNRDEIVADIIISMKDKLKNNSNILEHFYCMDAKTIKKLSDSGTIFGGHTHTHTILTALSNSEAEKEIRLNKKKIEKLLGVPCNFFAYPNGSKTDFNNNHKKTLISEGYKVSFSLTHGRSNVSYDTMEIARINVVPEDSVKSLLFRCAGMASIMNKVKSILQ
jgi:peptidoglycan/xylan/chitin deacetylase (PgdA/CDA1 family)